MRRRMARISALAGAGDVATLEHMRPAVGSIMRRTARPVVDLPQPDSPTSPSVSPRASAKLTPSTALMVPTWRWISTPLRSGKCTLRPSTRSSSSPATAPALRMGATAPLRADVIEAGLEMPPAYLDERRIGMSGRCRWPMAAGWKRQPAGSRADRAAGPRSVPGGGWRRCRAAARRPSGRACRDAWPLKSSRAGAVSTMRPAYITATRSASWRRRPGRG